MTGDILKKMKTKQKQKKSSTRRVRYDPAACTYTASESEIRRLQRKYPYADIDEAIAEAGRHTQTYGENARMTIEADPVRVLESDLELRLFQPEPERQAESLAELAKQIMLCPTFVNEALTGRIDMTLARHDLERLYKRYRELGGADFEPAANAAASLNRLLDLCGGRRREPRLQEMDIRILRYLHTWAYEKKQSDIEADLQLSQTTVGKRLKRLRQLGLIEWMRGHIKP